MNTLELRKQLLQAMESSDFLSEAESITANLRDRSAGMEFVKVILRFMEDYPAFDFGTPGPLVHFVEEFFGCGYEGELVESVARKPTVHTVWMLNRIINGTNEAAERQRLIEVLRQCLSHREADLEAKVEATHFLQRLSS